MIWAELQSCPVSVNHTWPHYVLVIQTEKTKPRFLVAWQSWHTARVQSHKSESAMIRISKELMIAYICYPVQMLQTQKG